MYTELLQNPLTGLLFTIVYYIVLQGYIVYTLVIQYIIGYNIIYTSRRKRH